MSSYLSNRMFWLSTLERAIKTLCQTALAGLTVTQGAGTFGLDGRAADWHTVCWMSLSAAVLSVLTSVSSGPAGERNTPSLVATAAGAAVPAPAGTAAPVPAPASPVKRATRPRKSPAGTARSTKKSEN